MLGKHLISRHLSIEDTYGTLLSVTKDDDCLVISGVLLKQCRIDNQIITQTTIDRVTWNEPLEVFDNNTEKKKLIGGGSLIRDKGMLMYSIKLLESKLCSNITTAINSLGFNAFDRMYPVVPVMEVEKKDSICSVCDNPVGDNGCIHVVGKDYMRIPCRIKVLTGKITSLVWSGLRDFK